MKRSFALAFSILLLSVATTFAQNPSNIVKKDLSQSDIDRIIKKFSENEAAFRQALTSYVFNRSADIQTIGLGGNSTGQYRRDSFMTFTADGGRFEKILYAPVSTLTEMTITPEDLEDLGGVTPFAIEPKAVPDYNFTYVGVEKIDELNLYVFDVQPKVIPDPKKSKLRLFSGRIWVDTDDLMIVKSKGKAVPETKNDKYPVVETTRQQVDGKFWFPADARSDDELVFGSGQVVRLRMRVKYSNYRVGRSDVRILDDDTPTPTPSPTPKKPDQE